MTSFMTPERLDDLRRKEVRDRATFKRMAIVVPVIVAMFVAFELADIVRVPARSTIATVQSLDDTWTLKHGRRCLTQLTTALGPASVHTSGSCRDVRWRVGQSGLVQAKVFRLSGYVAISPGTSMFRGASGSPF